MLKNKDGTPYKLNAPNPIMKTQEIWEGFTIHNMKWEGEKVKDNQKVTPIKTDFEVKDSFLAELEKTKDIKVVETKIEEIEEIKETKEITRTPIVVKPEKPLVNKNDGITKIFIHCLPASIKERKDSLYGDSYSTIQYGEPLSFEGVILRQGDLGIEIWTDVKNINSGSILYPKTNVKRWWRVQNTTPKEGGWIITATPSEYQPSFT